MKKNLRKIAIEKRARINSDYAKNIAPKKLAENFFANVQLPKNSIIGCYMSTKCELDVSILSAQCEANGHLLCLPCLSNVMTKMVFRAYKIGDKLQPNKFAILEPLASAKQVQPNVVLAPMLAFDRAKQRLGYGGGYYDKYLENMDILKIGIAYSAQEVEHIPVELHDIKMDKIVTEDFVL